jgi:ADP-ribose pyrophosphatase YjhB (NUDIX family)
MRPKNVDSNLYNYHLKALIKDGYVEHNKIKGYRLSPLGLGYAEQASSVKFQIRQQPKIITMIYIENEKQEVLLWCQPRQPFIDAWAIVNGKVHYEDESIESAARREIDSFLNKPIQTIRQVGLAEVNVKILNNKVTHFIAHIFVAKLSDNNIETERMEWININNLPNYKLAPAAKQIIELAKNEKTFFYEHFDVDW